jgi:septum formation protein
VSEHVSSRHGEPQLWLASASPRRAELLSQIGVRFGQFAVAVDESPLRSETSEDYVARVTQAKLEAALTLTASRAPAPAGRALPVLAADTAVVIDGEPLGKPADRDDAVRMLERLSGRAHDVLTAVALARPGEPPRAHICRTRVWLRPTTAQERERYWATGEPRDKAGAYAIQGRAAVFVERIEGSYSSVMGLPLFETAGLLQAMGVSVV